MKYDFYDDICDIKTESTDEIEISTDEQEEEIDDGEKKKKKIAKAVAVGTGAGIIGAAVYHTNKNSDSSDKLCKAKKKINDFLDDLDKYHTKPDKTYKHIFKNKKEEEEAKKIAKEDFQEFIDRFKKKYKENDED